MLKNPNCRICQAVYLATELMLMECWWHWWSPKWLNCVFLELFAEVGSPLLFVFQLHHELNRKEWDGKLKNLQCHLPLKPYLACRLTKLLVVKESSKDVECTPKRSSFCKGVPLCGWKNFIVWNFYMLISTSLNLRILFFKCCISKHFNEVFPFPTSDRLHSSFSLWNKLRSNFLGKDFRFYKLSFFCGDLTCR